jgi:hypothetical protein
MYNINDIQKDVQNLKNAIVVLLLPLPYLHNSMPSYGLENYIKNIFLKIIQSQRSAKRAIIQIDTQQVNVDVILIIT